MRATYVMADCLGLPHRAAITDAVAVRLHKRLRRLPGRPGLSARSLPSRRAERESDFSAGAVGSWNSLPSLGGPRMWVSPGGVGSVKCERASHPARTVHLV
jgi:hypothetical protein